MRVKLEKVDLAFIVAICFLLGAVAALGSAERSPNPPERAKAAAYHETKAEVDGQLVADLATIDACVTVADLKAFLKDYVEQNAEHTKKAAKPKKPKKK